MVADSDLSLQSSKSDSSFETEVGLSMRSDYLSWSCGFQSPLPLQFLFILSIVLATHTLALTSHWPERQHHGLTSHHYGCCPGPRDWLAVLVDFMILQVNCCRCHMHHLPPPLFLIAPCLHSLLPVVSRYVFLQVCPSFPFLRCTMAPIGNIKDFLC